MSKIDKIIEFLIKGLIFVLPLFFLPWTNEFFEFNKQRLLFLIVPLIAFLTLLKIFKGDKKFFFKSAHLDIPAVTFLVVVGLSSIFSIDKFSSFFGYYGRFSDAWIGWFGCILFYFVISNFVSSKKCITSIIELLLYSYSIILIFSFFSLFNLWEKIFINLKFVPISFNPIGGSLEWMAVYGSIMTVLLFAFLFLRSREGESHYNEKRIEKRKFLGLLLQKIFWAMILFLSLAFLECLKKENKFK